MRLGCGGCLIVFIGVSVLWGGGQMLYVGLTNRTVTSITIDEVIREKPDAKWLSVTGGVLDVLDSAYTESIAGERQALYIPVHPESEDDDFTGDIHVLYKTEELRYMKLADTIESFDDTSAEMDIEEFVALSARMRQRADVTGLVVFGIESGQDEDNVRALFDNLSEDCLIIEGGERPEGILAGIAMTLLGLALAVGGMLSRPRRKGLG